ncbi:MAG: site-specific DNA-methyltransferase [Flavobacteriaceae bacterium]|nr:site-specific DNA-methyltransferase [Flavobacteriaceae bacterium]
MNRKINKTETSSFGVSGRYGHNSEKFYNTNLYHSTNKESNNKQLDQVFPEDLKNKIICSSSENMCEIPDSSVHLIVTSPPYNVSKEYDQDLTLSEYIELLERVFSECHRVLVDGGRIGINLANVGRKPYIPITDYVSNLMLDKGFLMRGEIIWNKSASAGGSTAWGSWQSASNPILRDVHEYILVFSKGFFKRNLSELEKENKRNTIARDKFMEWTKSIWTFKTESAKRVKHPAPFPVELPYRLIQLLSFSGDVILDPFMGSGSTAIRKFVKMDILVLIINHL